jgi:hypothetical protein
VVADSPPPWGWREGAAGVPQIGVIVVPQERLAGIRRGALGPVREGRRPPGPAPLIPRAATQAGATSVTHVDLRGSRVAAVAADVYAFAFTETTSATAMQSARVATSEGDGDERVAGLALGTTSTLWTLTESSYGGDANSARISRLTNGCLTWKTLTNSTGPAEADGYPATALTADGPTIYLVVAGTGIVAHEFAPQVSCT